VKTVPSLQNAKVTLFCDIAGHIFANSSPNFQQSSAKVQERFITGEFFYA